MESRIWVRRRRSDREQSDAKPRGRWAQKSRKHPSCCIFSKWKSNMPCMMGKVMHFLMCQVLHLFQRRRKRKKQEQVKQDESAERVTITLFLAGMNSMFCFTVNNWTFIWSYTLGRWRWGWRCRVRTGRERVRSGSWCWRGETKSAKREGKGRTLGCLK